MRAKLFFLMIMLLALNRCSNPETFDQDVWQSNNELNDRFNPRWKMTKDLMKNYLHPGMRRDSVILLLGDPYSEKIENRVPRGVEIPDSLQGDSELKNINDWLRAHHQPDTLMRYPIGWSTIDPNFLIIKLGQDSTVSEFWIEQG